MREDMLQQVEYQQQHQEADWRGRKIGGAITNYKIEDLAKTEPSADTGHNVPFADIFIH
jgi:hypothetical protein